MFIEKHLFSIFFIFANFCVCFNTKLHKNIPNIDFMAILMKLATCHVRNAFKRPLRPNAPTVRVLTSVILKGIGCAFRKTPAWCTRVYWLLNVYKCLWEETSKFYNVLRNIIPSVYFTLEFVTKFHFNFC